MQFALADALLLKYVDGTYPRPGLAPDGSSEAVKAESLRDQNSWDAQDGRASARLGYMCSQDVQQFLDIETSSSRTSAQTLEFLKEKFTPSGLAAKWAALSKLSSISYKGSITNMSAEFKTVWTEMTDLNVELKDVILLTLLNNLGPGWNRIKSNQATRLQHKISSVARSPCGTAEVIARPLSKFAEAPCCKSSWMIGRARGALKDCMCKSCINFRTMCTAP